MRDLQCETNASKRFATRLVQAPFLWREDEVEKGRWSLGFTAPGEGKELFVLGNLTEGREGSGE